MMALHRMRTVNEVFRIVKAADPETALTPNYIRTLCKNGEVHSVLTGKKLLVDLDDFLRVIDAAKRGERKLKHKLDYDSGPLISAIRGDNIRLE